MNKQGEIFLKTCIEYLKEMDETSEGKEIQTILRRSTIDFIKTNKFSNKIWNQMKEDINLRVPIPLLARAKELRNDLVQLFGQVYKETQTSVYKGYKQDKIEMRGDRAEMSDFPLYLNTVAGGLDRRDQTIGGFSFVVKIYALPVVEIIG